MGKCVTCPTGYATSYSISGGANYNPYHCYNFPYTSISSTPTPNTWNQAYSYCNSLGVPNFTLLTVENAYDRATANYFMIGWCVWIGAQTGSASQSYFYYYNGVAAPTPYYFGSTPYYYAPANYDLVWLSSNYYNWVNGLNIISSGCNNCRCTTCCQYGL